MEDLSWMDADTRTYETNVVDTADDEWEPWKPTPPIPAKTGPSISDRNREWLSTFCNAPAKPFKVADVPMTAINAMYGKEEKIQVDAENCYYTWEIPGRPPQDRRFTAVFICPKSGELFLSGRWKTYGETIAPLLDSSAADAVDLVWFTTKKNAQHGAAARAWDCRAYREHHHQQQNMMATDMEALPYLTAAHIGNEKPHLEPMWNLPDFVSKYVHDQVRERQTKLQDKRHMLMAYEEEVAWRHRPDQEQHPFESSNGEDNRRTSPTIADVSPTTRIRTFYEEQEQTQKITDENYIVWEKPDRLPHQRLFTGIFLCPISGEVFLSIPWNGLGETDETDGLVWFSSKKNARYGAAANAIDCLYRRKKTPDMCLDEDQKDHPVEEPVFVLPDAVPKPIRDDVLQRQNMIQEALQKQKCDT
jgi:hypothetical protein